MFLIKLYSDPQHFSKKHHQTSWMSVPCQIIRGTGIFEAVTLCSLPKSSETDRRIFFLIHSRHTWKYHIIYMTIIQDNRVLFGKGGIRGKQKISVSVWHNAIQTWALFLQLPKSTQYLIIALFKLKSFCSIYDSAIYSKSD